MNFSVLVEAIRKSIIPKIEKHRGIESYTNQRSRFEGWLQVEIVGLLKTIMNNENVIPEKHNDVDIVVGDWAIELKVLTSETNNQVPTNICDLKRSIEKRELIKNSKLNNNVIILIVYPKIINNSTYDNHINEIKMYFEKFEQIEIHFNELLKGVLYIGKFSKIRRNYEF